MKVYILVLFFCLTGFLNAQEDVEFANYYPIENNGKWHFETVSKEKGLNGKEYDSIHFCDIYYQTFFVTISKDSFEIYDQFLKPYFNGVQDSFLVFESSFFIRWKNSWIQKDVNRNTSTILDVDSIKVLNDICYLFKNEKIGLLKHRCIIPPIYDAITEFDRTDRESDYYLVLQNGKFGLLDFCGNSILPPVASIIQNQEFGILKYKEGTWKYLLPDSSIVNSNGCEIHFFAANSYKIYTEKREKSKLYKNGKQVVNSSHFDDFFPLAYTSFFAVRKNMKIGVVDQGFHLIVPVEYDQIEFLEDNYFKFLLGETWGIVNLNGKVILKPNYNNIIASRSFGNQVQFVTIVKGKVGVVDENGNSIIPFEYSNIEYNEVGYIVKLKNLYGVYNSKGKLVLEPVYEKFKIGDSLMSLFQFKDDFLMVFMKNNTFTFVNRNEVKLDIEPCLDYKYSNNVLKCYYKNKIDVHYLDKATISEKITYDKIQSIVIQYDKSWFGYDLLELPKSYFELNQLTGLYGARNFLDVGFLLNPTYAFHKTTQYHSFDKFQYGTIETGIVWSDSLEYKINDGISVKVLNSFNEIHCSAASFSFKNIISSNCFNRSFYSKSTEDDFVLFDDNAFTWFSNSLKSSKTDEIITSKGFKYCEDLDTNFQRVYIGGEIIVQPIEISDVSLMDYFHFLNPGNNLWFMNTDEAKLFMSPFLGVKFVGGEWVVRSKYERNVTFKYSLETIQRKEMWPLWEYQIKGENTIGITNDLKFKSESFEDMKSFEVPTDQNNEFIIVEKSKNQLAQINTEYPNFIFTSEKGISYTNGRIVFTEKGMVGLKRPDNSIVVPANYNEIEWLNDSIVLLKNTVGWRISNKEGELFSSDVSIEKPQIKNDLIYTHNEGKYIVYNLNSTVKYTSELGEPSLYNDSYYIVIKGFKYFFYSSKGIVDSLSRNENILENNWIIGSGKEQGSWYVRKIEGKPSKVIFSDLKPELMGNCFVYQMKNIKGVIDYNLNISEYKKCKKQKKYYDKITCLYFKKEIKFIDENGVVFHVSKPMIDVVDDQYVFHLMNKDTSYTVSVEKWFLPDVDDKSKIVKNNKQYSTIQDKGKWGLIDENGAVVIPFKYDQMKLLSNGNVEVLIGSVKGLVTTSLKKVTDVIYDEIICAGELGFLVKDGNEYKYLDFEGKVIQFKNL